MKKSKIIAVIGIVMFVSGVILYLKTSTNTNPIAEYAIAGIILGCGIINIAILAKAEGD